MSYQLLIPSEAPPGQCCSACLLLQVADGDPVARVTAGPPPRLGANLRLSDDGTTVVATAAGRVVVDGDRLWIVPAKVFRGNVDPGTGNVDVQTEVIADGNVADCMKVASAAGVYVRGSVESADICCGGDLHVCRGIAGKDKGTCRVGGAATVRFLDGANVRARGNVTSVSEVGRSRVVSGGAVSVGGAVFASHVTANGGITCKTLGAPADARTVAEAGVDQDLVDACAAVRPRIELLQRQAVQIRQSVEPLLRNAKQLSAAQKEKATELLFQADDYETQAEDLLRDLRGAYAAATESARGEVRVEELLHAGVILRFRGIEAKTVHAFRGPVVVSVKRIDHTPVVCVRDAGGRDFVALESHGIASAEYDWMELMFHPAHVKPVVALA